MEILEIIAMVIVMIASLVGATRLHLGLMVMMLEGKDDDQ